MLFVAGRIEPRVSCVLNTRFASEPNTPSPVLASDMNMGIAWMSHAEV